MPLITAYAKINLGLHILGRRPDGYHEIDTVFQSISLADELEIDLAAHGVRVEMSPADGVKEEENLVYRAAQVFAAHIGYQGGVRIRVRKGIPFAAGLGGASSDAAATLVALATLLNLKLDRRELAELALGLGSDAPFFLTGGLWRGRGRGESLERLPPTLSGRSIVLFKPAVSLSSSLVYAEYDRLQEGKASVRSASLADDTPFDCTNDLLEAAARLCPVLWKYQNFLADQQVDRGGLSGSGPTFYAAFSEKSKAESFARAARGRLGAWVQIVEATDVAQRWIIAP